jgi:hypothetical protein
MTLLQAAVPVAPARDFGDAFLTSLTGALAMFMSAIPRVIGFLVILGAGWFLAGLLGKGVASLLRAVKFNELAERSGLSGFVQQMGVRTDAAGLIASVTKWFVRLIALVVAFDALGIPAVSGVLQELLLWLPNLVVGIVALVVGGLVATALSRLVRGATAEAGFSNPDTLAAVTKGAVWAFAIVVAVNQVGIATVVVNTLLIGVVAAVSLASGLAFGLGGRDRAARVLDGLGAAAAANAPRMQRAAGAMREQAGEMAGEAAAATGGNQVRNRLPEEWRQRSGVDRRRNPEL